METPDLPLEPLLTLPGLKTWLKIDVDDDTDDAVLAPIILVVDVLVRGLPIAEKAAGQVEWPTTLAMGATLLAARLWARRDSPEGVAQFAADGPVYVQRNDPDVAMLLQLGAWSAPGSA